MANTSKQSAIEASTQERIQQIAMGAFDAVRKIDGARSDASAAYDTAKENSAGTREAILIKCAALAVKGKWLNPDIDAGISAALTFATNGQKNNSLATWAAQMKLACHTQVRDHVETFYDVATRLWTAEKDAIKADKDAERPLTAAFSRKDHMVMALMGAAVGQEATKTKPAIKPVVLTDETDILAYAEERDPAKDANRIARRIASIAGTLREFSSEFPHPGFDACLKFLDNVKAESLTGARSKAQEKPAKPAPKTNGAAPVAGVSDIMDDIDFAAI